jgi:hypothetical protein
MRERSAKDPPPANEKIEKGKEKDPSRQNLRDGLFSWGILPYDLPRGRGFP